MTQNKEPPSSKQGHGKGSVSHPLFCFYSSDILRQPEADDEKTSVLHLRDSPFDSNTLRLAATNINGVRDLLQHDQAMNVYYLPIGAPPVNTVVATPHLKWPPKYSVVMWVRWRRNVSYITTFDSSSHSPIFCQRRRLGCAAGRGWLTLDNHEISYDSWQFVAAFGGDGKTTFHIGDLRKAPEYIGSVKCCISGHSTDAIGNASQGPGDVACIYVFDQHISKEELQHLYSDSTVMIGEFWSKEQASKVQEMICNYFQVDDVARVVFEFLLGN